MGDERVVRYTSSSRARCAQHKDAGPPTEYKVGGIMCDARMWPH